MSAPPFMPLYVADYLADTTHLTQAEHGAYLLLLMALWRSGGRLPNDDAKLARFSRSSPGQWAKIRATVMAFFTLNGDDISHGRLEAEREKYDLHISQRAKAGRASATARSLKNNKVDPTGVDVSLQQPEPEPEPDIRGSTPSVSHRARGATKSKRCPPDYQPSEKVLEVGRSCGLSDDEIAFELDKLKDYQFRDAHSDWDAAFRNWLRRAGERPRRAHAGAQPMSFGMMDAVNEELGFRMAKEALSGGRNGNTGRDQGVVIALPSPETRAEGPRAVAAGFRN